MEQQDYRYMIHLYYHPMIIVMVMVWSLALDELNVQVLMTYDYCYYYCCCCFDWKRMMLLVAYLQLQVLQTMSYLHLMLNDVLIHGLTMYELMMVDHLLLLQRHHYYLIMTVLMLSMIWMSKCLGHLVPSHLRRPHHPTHESID
jgi:hypothetical protein